MSHQKDSRSRIDRQLDARELGRAPGKSTLAPMLQRKNNGDGLAHDADEQVDRASSSSGSPLPAALQRKFESSLGADLSGVRVHNGSESASAAESVSARAYTVGSDIHFGAGQYDPSSRGGEELLAHEVAHTVQQAAGAARKAQFKLDVSQPGDAHELEADAAASAMVDGREAQVSGAAGVARKVMRDVRVPGIGPTPMARDVILHPRAEFWYFGRNIIGDSEFHAQRDTKVVTIPERHGGVLRIRVSGMYLGEARLGGLVPPSEVDFEIEEEWTLRPDASGSYSLSEPTNMRNVPYGPVSITPSVVKSADGAAQPFAQLQLQLARSGSSTGASAEVGAERGPVSGGVSTGSDTTNMQGNGDCTFRVEFHVPPRLEQPAPAPPQATASASATATANASATAIVQGPAAVPLPPMFDLHFPYGQTEGDRFPIERWAARLTPDQRGAITSGRLILQVAGYASTGTQSTAPTMQQRQDVNRRIARSRADWVAGVLASTGLPVHPYSYGSSGSPDQDFAPDRGVENLQEQRVEVTVTESHVQR